MSAENLGRNPQRLSPCQFVVQTPIRKRQPIVVDPKLMQDRREWLEQHFGIDVPEFGFDRVDSPAYGNLQIQPKKKRKKKPGERTLFK